jgi:hypothetical protein
MKQVFAMFFVVFVLAGCMGGGMHGTTEQHKHAELEYTSAGITNGFKLAGIATGTYKAYETQVGLIYYGGSQNTFITLDAPQKWSIKSESKAQSFKVDGIDLRLKNPYVGTVKHGDETIGHIGLSLPGGDYTKKALDMVGLGVIMSRNYRIVGEANILGRTYNIDSVFKDEDGDVQSSPEGYRVIHKNKTLGMVKVGKNAFGGQTLEMWIAPGLDPVVEESAVACLLVSGYVF